MSSYPGGKNLAGTYQRIINQIPPHAFFIEPFAGSAAIARLKLPAERTLLLDLDPGAIGDLAGTVPAGTQVRREDGLAWLRREGPRLERTAVIYADPPYLPSACASPLRYRHRLSERQHDRLITYLRACRCRVLLSGYWSELYAQRLSDWRAIHWPQITRGGYCQEEWLWCNFAEPTELHDYRYLGANYREREDLARMKKRWTARLRGMTRLKRLAMMAAIANVNGPEGTTGGDAERGPEYFTCGNAGAISTGRKAACTAAATGKAGGKRARTAPAARPGSTGGSSEGAR